MCLIPKSSTQRWLFSLLVWSLTSLTGCGSNPAQPPIQSLPLHSNITSGNWSIVATSAQAPTQVLTIGGSIVQKGLALSGNVHVLGPCEDPSANEANVFVPITGTVSGDKFELQAGPTTAGTTLHFDLSSKGNSLQSLTGTFTASGNYCGSADQGSVAANLVPSMTGAWAGQGIPSAGHSGVNVRLNINQDQTPNEFGSYALTGTVTYINASCEADASEIMGWVAGSMVFVGYDFEDEPPVNFTARGSSTAPFTTLVGSYQTIEGSPLPLCGGDQGSITFERQ
jgi:hypothetical protein